MINETDELEPGELSADELDFVVGGADALDRPLLTTYDLKTAKK